MVTMGIGVLCVAPRQWPALWPPSTCRISPVTKRRLEIQHGVDDVGHLAHVADRMQRAERGMRFGADASAT